MGIKPLLYYDLETGGTNPGTHAVLQISCILEYKGEKIDSFTTYAKPHRNDAIEDEALEVTGIKQDDINDFPDAYEAFEKFGIFLANAKEKFNSRVVPVAYNAHFDNSFIKSFWAKSMKSYKANRNINDYIDFNNCIDPYTIFNFLNTTVSGDRKLGSIAKRFDIQIKGNLHDAENDTKLCRRVLHALLQQAAAGKGMPQTPSKTALLDIIGYGDRKYGANAAKTAISVTIENKKEGQFIRYLPNNNGDYQKDAPLHRCVPTPRQAKKEIEEYLSQFIDRYDTEDKLTPVAINYDTQIAILKNLWLSENDDYLGSFFQFNRQIDPKIMENALPYIQNYYSDSVKNVDLPLPKLTEKDDYDKIKYTENITRQLKRYCSRNYNSAAFDKQTNKSKNQKVDF